MSVAVSGGEAAEGEDDIMIKKIFPILFAVSLLMSVVVYGAAGSGNDQLLTVVHNGKNNYFNVIAQPGQQIYLEYSLENRTEDEITNSIIIYDSKTAVNGGNIIMSPESMEVENTSTWFTENYSLVTLRAGESKDTKMIINVPEICEPGIYTAIFGVYSSGVNELLTEGNKEEIHLDIKSYYTSTLAIIIEIGEKPFRSVEFGDEVRLEADSQTGGCFLYVPVNNYGYAYEFPIVSVDVKDKNMDTVFKGEIAMDIVYASTDSYACFDTKDKILMDGEYTISAIAVSDKELGFPLTKKLFKLNLGNDIEKKVQNLKLIDAATDVKEGSGFFIISKLQMFWILISSGAVLISTIFIILLVKRRKNRSKNEDGKGE